MLLQRFITALVLAPLMLAGIFLLPDLYFRVFIGLIVLLGAWEWANIAGLSTVTRKVSVIVMAVCCMAVPHVLIPVSNPLWISTVLVSLLWWVVAIVVICRFPASSSWLSSQVLKLIVALPVLGGFWMGLVWLKNQPDADLLLTWLMLLVWGADIGAYFAGRRFGRRKLAPKISPGKTWAGVYGGMATSILVSVVITLLYLQESSVVGWFWLLTLSAAIVALSVIGDLFESLLKRHRGIKDSSGLLPGHGGVLDRIDSLSAATPLFVLLWFVLSVV